MSQVPSFESYGATFADAFAGYARYLGGALTEPSWTNWIYVLGGLSLAVYGLELLVPWRKGQPRVRRDFWIDAFYMAFNFFLFSLLGWHAVWSVFELAVADLRGGLGLTDVAVDIAAWPVAVQLGVMLVARDFLHYWIHRVLHRIPWLWRFHRVHHSTTQMGFAAHLRFHWMETVVYRTLEYIPLGLIGFGVQEFFAVHLIALTIGHLNHANIRVPLGPLRYVLNSPQMHLWHHARELPTRSGANFGLTFSLWDWLFGTVHWPNDDPDLPLGFDGVESYPTGFIAQNIEPFRSDG
ncbi:MAG: sterol desaturase family protein [Myxococcota bacterium]